eukprot:1143269-Prorocentrum_lima.AAC.1
MRQEPQIGSDDVCGKDAANLLKTNCPPLLVHIYQVHRLDELAPHALRPREATPLLLSPL